MRTFTTAQAREQLADLIRYVRATREAVAVTRYGRPLIAIVPIEDCELPKRLRRARGAALARSRGIR
jgi:prevent-host-death family protein